MTKKPKNWTDVEKLDMGIRVPSRGVCFHIIQKKSLINNQNMIYDLLESRKATYKNKLYCFEKNG